MRAGTAVLIASAIIAGAASAQVGNGPWNNDLDLFDSKDGLSFTRVGRFVQAGGVPSLLRDRKGRVLAAFQWFPTDRSAAFDRIAVRISTDNGKSWTNPTPVEIAGFPATADRGCDPTLVELEDGRTRLYFTSHERGSARGATYSALSSDGVHYTFEPGMRFGLEGHDVLDCAVAALGKKWHYFSPVQERPGYAYHAVSEDGLKFTRLADVTAPGARNWLGCAVAVPRGLRFYGTGEGVWSAYSRDGSTWAVEAGGRGMGADPGVAVASDGRALMVATVPGQIAATQKAERASLSANEQFIYVRRGDELLQYDARTLRLIQRTRITDE